MVCLNSEVTVHLKKLEHNLKIIRKQIGDTVKVMAVVKDDAYGHGVDEIAAFLQDKVEWFCVVRTEEGKRLREIGIQNPILVFEAPQKEKLSWYKDFNLTATVGDFTTLDLLEPGTEYHINIDTGMHRLGILPDEIDELLLKIQDHPELIHTGLYTHLYKSDDPGNPEPVNQLRLFEEIRAQFPDDIFTHTSNSGGVFHYQDPKHRFDGVRPGISLYGYPAGEVPVNQLEPIIDWSSYLMQVKPIRKGETVSYGARWASPEDGFIGVIPVGYSHGLFRLLSGKIQISIEGKLYAQVGTITMDYIVVYLGKDKPEAGTTVFLLKGKELDAKMWADSIGTIPYEITTSIKESVKKVYLD